MNIPALRRSILPLLTVGCLLGAALAEKEPAANPASLVPSLMAASRELEHAAFPDIVKAATGHRVLPCEATDEISAAVEAHISSAADRVLVRLNAADSPARGLRRINEASRHVEDMLVEELNRNGFACATPPTKSGDSQRSGYPDLRLVHEKSGRVTYLDPKLYEASARTSTLRTFYYEPRETTGKVTEDAHHLLLGLAHDGKDGAWTFQSWDLVDLSKLLVRVKIEFQAANRDIYKEDAVLKHGAAK